MSSWHPPHTGGLALQPVCGHWGQREQAANRSQTSQLSRGSLDKDMKELSPLDTHGVRSDPKQRRPIKRRSRAGIWINGPGVTKRRPSVQQQYMRLCWMGLGPGQRWRRGYLGDLSPVPGLGCRPLGGEKRCA
ncbi:unnamed protein product [Arctogadus glacialis]